MQPLILSALLSAAGYIGDTKHQTAEVVQAIRYGTGLIPAVILIIGIILLAMVPINHKRELEIQAAIEEKHSKRLRTGFRNSCYIYCRGDRPGNPYRYGETIETLHVISHTHWDREWYLTFQQFRLKLVHLIDKLLDILDEDPNFKNFMLDGQTIVLDDYLHMRPENEEKLRRHIQDGRILIGPWHILPDMFLVSPEAHIRNLLQGARTARKFGPKMPIGYIPDPFGHPGQVPQILKGFGIETAALWRGLSDQPAELWWQSPDGSKVLLAYLRDSYSNGANLPVPNYDLFAQRIAVAGNSLAAHSAVNDHLIMLGTDHMEPSAHTSAAIAYANEHLPDTRVIHSTLPGYIESVQAQIENLEQTIPTVHGELRACDRSPLLPGVLSTRMWIKQRNQHSQTLLEKWAEPFSVFAENMIARQDKPTAPEEMASNRIRNVAPIIRQAWRLLMENHPHDSICGCSIDQVHDEMKPRFDQVDQIAEEITHQALHALSGAVDTQFTGVFAAVVLFNPFGHKHHDLIEVALNIPEGIAAYELISADKTVIPHEFIDSNNDELANVLLRKSELRGTIGAITDGRVAGAAIVKVKVSRQGSTVSIDAILDNKGQPSIPEWRQAEKDIAAYESDPGVTHFHLLARTPQASKIRFITPDIPALGWRTLWVRAIPAQTSAPAATVSPLLKPFLPLVLRFAQSDLGANLLAALDRGDEKKPPFVIENEYYRVEAAHDGTLTVIDKRTNTIFSGLNRFVDGGDGVTSTTIPRPKTIRFPPPNLPPLKYFAASWCRPSRSSTGSTSPPSYPPIGKPARTNESSFPLPAAFRSPQVSRASISSLKWITVPGITACACISPRPLQWMPPTTTVTLKWYGARSASRKKGKNGWNPPDPKRTRAPLPLSPTARSV